MSVQLGDNSRESIERIINQNSDKEAYYKIRALCFMKLNVGVEYELCKYIPRQRFGQEHYCMSQGAWAGVVFKDIKKATQFLDQYILKPSHPEKLPELPREKMDLRGARKKEGYLAEKSHISSNYNQYTKEYLESLSKEDLILLILYPSFEVVKEKMRQMMESGKFDDDLIKCYQVYCLKEEE